MNTKIAKDRQDHLKILALKNFALTKQMEEWVALELVVVMFEKSFMDEPMRQFLDYLLGKYKIDYTKWAFKSAWVKEQIVQANGVKGQLEFGFSYEMVEKARQLQRSGVHLLRSFPYQQVQLDKQNTLDVLSLG